MEFRQKCKEFEGILIEMPPPPRGVVQHECLKELDAETMSGENSVGHVDVHTEAV